MRKRGSRLGGANGQYALRFLGGDSDIPSQDAEARLLADGLVETQPTSMTARAAVQRAVNGWAEESGRSLTEISRTRAFSTG